MTFPIRIRLGNFFNAQSKRVNFGILLFILAFFLIYLPKIIDRVRVVDEIAGRTISNWDDKFYQILAVNMLRGFGYNDEIHFPLEEYQITPKAPIVLEPYSFHFPPGPSLWLAFVYRLFGQETINARYSYAVAIWLSAFVLPLVGYFMAGYKGCMAGGLAGFYYLNFGGGVQGADAFYAGRILAEPLSAFCLVNFALFLTLYFRYSQPLWLYLAGAALVGFIACRSNFLLTLPVFFLYLYYRRVKKIQLLTFILITALPVLAWSAYASMVKGQLVLFTSLGESFPAWNNMDVITGIGPLKLNQGGWQPGFALDESGELIITNANQVKPGENPWLKGFRFWLENPEKLPLLFYVKLRAAGWYYDSTLDIPFFEARIYYIAVGFLLMSLGFRNERKIEWLPFSSEQLILIQFGLVSLLLMIGNSLPFFVILMLWSVILAIALFFPIGEDLLSPNHSPSWLNIFLLAYLVTTLLFGGNKRFHFPLDPFLMFVGFLGLAVAFETMIRKHGALAGLFYLIVFIFPLFKIFQFLFAWVARQFSQIY